MTTKKSLITDIHCHPSMRPFTRSLPEGINDPDPNSKQSIWHYDAPTWWKELLQKLTGVCKYSQSNYTAMAKGNIKFFCSTLYAFELGFIITTKYKWLSPYLVSFTTGIQAKNLKYISRNKSYNYYDNLKKEHNYLLQMNEKEVTIENGEKWTYKICRSYDELSNAIDTPNMLGVVINIEGGHNFAPWVLSAEKPATPEYDKAMLDHLREVKNWEYRPFYITIVHHFYNGICGNTRSIKPGAAAKMIDQRYKLGTGFTKLGEEFVDIMLDNSEGKRILVDAKHLSVTGRVRYYELLATKYKDEEIPILYTHTGVNGRKSIHDLFKKGVENKWDQSSYCTNEPPVPELKEEFNDWCINLFDDEIEIIARSKGLMGLEFDDRIAGYHKKTKTSDGNPDRMELIWNNIEHIALVLDKAGLPAWDSMCVGSDFDGIINSVTGVWTEAQMPFFRKFLIAKLISLHASNEFHPMNQLTPEEIVDKFFCDNLHNFFKKHLKN